MTVAMRTIQKEIMGEEETETEKKDEEDIRGNETHTQKHIQKHYLVLSSQVLSLSHAHRSKATADCQKKQEQKTEARGRAYNERRQDTGE